MKKYLYLIIKIFLLAIIPSIVVYIYIGFYYPDPYGIKTMPLYNMILWGIRIGFPFLFFLIIFFYFCRKKYNIKIENIILLIVSCFFMILLAYPIINIVSHMSSTLEGRYHPYLQLMPNKILPDCNRGEFRIFCLGGSTTEYKDSLGKDWPERVEKRLQDHFRTDTIRVFNCGCQWYTSLHSLINYTTNLRKYKPEIILWMHTINDLLHNADFSYFSHGMFREDYGHFYGPLNQVMTHTSIEVLFFRNLKKFWYHTPRTIVKQDTFPGINSFTSYMNTLIDIAEHDGIKIVLMTQPCLYKKNMSREEISKLYMLHFEAIGERHKWDYETVFTGFKMYTQNIRQTSSTRNIPIIDLERKIPKTLEYFKDDVHYTDVTFEMIAQEISSVLINYCN